VNTPGLSSEKSSQLRKQEGNGKDRVRSGAVALQSWTVGDHAVPGMVAFFLLAQLKPSRALWGYGRFVLNASAFKTISGLRFAKHLGSGYNGGFGLRPSFDRQALFLVFEDQTKASAFFSHPLYDAYKARCIELLTLKLHPYACKGSWSGFSMQPTRTTPGSSEPIAALTRASIRPSAAFSFWNDAAPAHQAIEHAPGCLLAAGVGEAPVLRQATLTLWENQAAMDAYSRSVAHGSAVRRSYGNNYFSEAMFVRFIAEDVQGVYKGRHYSEGQHYGDATLKAQRYG
jgi:heme-degrading monooxygenase HmoA